MPLTDFYTHAGATTAEDRQKISDAIQTAMKEVLGILDDDRLHFFHEFSAGEVFHEDVIFGLPRADRLLMVMFSLNERTAEVKNALYESAVKHLEAVAGWQRDEVMFRVIETASENWWADGRVVDPNTGYDERMTNA